MPWKSNQITSRFINLVYVVELLVSILKILGLKIANATYTFCEKFTIIVSRAKFELQQQHERMREIAEILRCSKFLGIINGFNGNMFNSAVLLHFMHYSIPALFLAALLQCSSSSFSFFLCLSAHFLSQAFCICNHLFIQNSNK